MRYIVGGLIAVGVAERTNELPRHYFLSRATFAHQRWRSHGIMDPMGLERSVSGFHRQSRYLCVAFPSLVLALMSETALYGEIMAELSRGHTRLFRSNAGFAWQGTVIEQTPQRLVLKDPRPIRVGIKGMSDLIGWSPTVVSGEGRVIVGENLFAVYTAIEVKGPKIRTTDEQIAFIETVRRYGGRAGIARSVEDARRITQPWLDRD